jgi:predicted metal-dependent phosphoesterase TrpH
MLKIELHAHTDQDPRDRISHSTEALIEHAATLGYAAVAITLHDRYFDPTPHIEFARRRGLVLLSGIERTIQGHHVLLINFPAEVGLTTSFEDIARLKAVTHGLVIAPHSFYPVPSALGLRLNQYASLIDAIEINAMYTRMVNFNRRAMAWAEANQKPLVGTTDLHVLEQMGTTYTLVDAPPDADAICESIRSGRVRVHTEPLSTARAAGFVGRMALSGLRGRLR